MSDWREDEWTLRMFRAWSGTRLFDLEVFGYQIAKGLAIFVWLMLLALVIGTSIGSARFAYHQPEHSIPQLAAIEVAAGAATFLLTPIIVVLASVRRIPVLSVTLLGVPVATWSAATSLGVTRHLYLEAACSLALIAGLEVAARKWFEPHDEARHAMVRGRRCLTLAIATVSITSAILAQSLTEADHPDELSLVQLAAIEVSAGTAAFLLTPVIVVAAHRRRVLTRLGVVLVCLGTARAASMAHGVTRHLCWKRLVCWRWSSRWSWRRVSGSVERGRLGTTQRGRSRRSIKIGTISKTSCTLIPTLVGA